MEKQIRTAALVLALAGCGGSRDTVIVGSKNFTESIILGEIIAQRIESIGLTVVRRFNLGGTFINHEAITADQLDVYVEYTGTAHSAVLQLPVEKDPLRVRDTVAAVYAERWGLKWLAPFGFDNTFAILVRGSVARDLNLRSVSDILPYAANWTAGFGHEFLNRADGYRGFIEHYGLEFDSPPVSMDLGLIYRAVAEERIDLTAGNSTDGQIRALDLYHLHDDLSYFPPYEAAPLVRSELLARYPQIEAELNALGGTLDEDAMAQMNFAVDVERRTPRDVAAEFLEQLQPGPAAR
ncbi:MAG: glycine betaine ABC transporter substrate-binding protein [Gemmatimonadales bacterium]